MARDETPLDVASAQSGALAHDGVRNAAPHSSAGTAQDDVASTDTPGAQLASLDRLRHAERRAAIARLASIIGHLIGTPLNVIAGRAALIRTTPGADAAVENARRIEEQVDRLAQRIRRLLHYLTTPEPEPEPRSVEAIVDETILLYAPIAAHGGINLVRPADVPDALVEGTSTTVVLTSLVSLALRATSAQSGFRFAVRVESASAIFDLTVPGLGPPMTQIDCLDPPDEDLQFKAEHLQVLSVCHAIARRGGGDIKVMAGERGSTMIRFETPLLS